MMDAWMGQRRYFASDDEAPQTQRTSAGVAIVDQGNASPRVVSPAGISRGLTMRTADLMDGDIFPGRLSLGILEVAIIGVVFFYLWTRNVQGGG